jgi:hypothetical protein
MSIPESYLNALINNEVANRGAFKLPGMTTDTAINALLLLGGRSNGYVNELDEKARQVIASGRKNGQRSTRVIQKAKPLSSQPIAPLPQSDASPTNTIAEPDPVEVPVVPNALPAWSVPDETGEPKFYEHAEEGPSAQSEEIRLPDGPTSRWFPLFQSRWKWSPELATLVFAKATTSACTGTMRHRS